MDAILLERYSFPDHTSRYSRKERCKVCGVWLSRDLPRLKHHIYGYWNYLCRDCAEKELNNTIETSRENLDEYDKLLKSPKYAKIKEQWDKQQVAEAL